jgi:hypothetical protein
MFPHVYGNQHSGEKLYLYLVPRFNRHGQAPIFYEKFSTTQQSNATGPGQTRPDEAILVLVVFVLDVMFVLMRED